MNTLLTEVEGDSFLKHRGFQYFLKTDGSTQYGQFPLQQWNSQPISNFFNNDKAFTYCFWSKKTSTGQVCYFNFPNSTVYQASMGDSFLTLGAGIGGWVIISNYSSTINRENHVAISYDGNSIFKIWINSIPQPFTTTGAKVSPLIYDDARFNSGGGVPSWDSAIADFRFFDNQLLTEQEVRNLYNHGWEYNLGGRTELVRLPMTLTSHFENNVPVTKCRALDISGNNNHLVLENMGTTPNLVTF